MTVASCLYLGDVVHQRLRPRRHEFSYRVFSMLLDLDELETLQASSRLFRLDRFGVFSFHARDHGDGAGALKAWVERQLGENGIAVDGGPIRILCYPRLFGYVFNPLSVYFCYRRDGALTAILYEVHNTFGQRHGYLVPVEGDGEGASARRRHACDKDFYVSPFIGMEARYDFHVVPPGDRVSVVIDESDADGRLLRAWFKGRRKPFDDRTLTQVLFRYPLMTLKVFGGIHWEALRLWWKGVPLFDRPPPPAQPVTLVETPSAR